ncbi:MAG TPA: pyridoxal-dependent decarboxylase [Bryobacteraceae bacterium]|nr:pyridoxal-dependent decarboxylase [Bryobacteraceae bacterium]
MADEKPTTREKTKRLGAWFLGPKAENASFEEEMILHVLRDYFYWRRNYFPSDEIIVTQQMRREFLDWTDALLQQLSEMLARLRRHFPFYSPRYIAHMLSDQTIPSVLGYFAGMLYNPNNVTPEAAPVTVEWELEVAADILKMLGYRCPPPPGAHHRELRREFGWAHITGGGTIANLEALWVTRNIRYFPPAVKRAAESHGIPIGIKLPGDSSHSPRSLTEIDERQLLFIKPNEAVYLLPRFIDAVRQHLKLEEHAAAARAWEMLRSSGLLPSNAGLVSTFANTPPALFVSGTAHYSLLKAADVLGIGKDNVVLVDVDRSFRMDVRDLEAKLRQAIQRGLCPLAVIAIAGTTEEGAVDPIHHIDELRHKLEAEENLSFWLHADAAWSGYVRSVFVPASPESESGDTEETIRRVNEFASRLLGLERGSYKKTIHLQWGSREVCNSFLAFPRAESITIDPHKMGYVPYPCGVVAFRNDRVRLYLTQEAPYITVTTSADLLSQAYEPPQNVGPFILEGSKPGAAAAGCWLSHRMIPPNRDGYGEIMRASLLGARELYERLVHWEPGCRANWLETRYEFLPITGPPPDTNIVCFVVKIKGDRSLARMNRLGEKVYGHFTIEAELGEREYAYAQPFFLSRTRFQTPQYSSHSVADLLERAGVDPEEYSAHGIFVLRATVMSPYIVFAAETGHKQDLLADFIETLAKTTEAVLAEV